MAPQRDAFVRRRPTISRFRLERVSCARATLLNATLTLNALTHYIVHYFRATRQTDAIGM
jgi:hypothetical protein